MVCERCGERPATINLTQIKDNQVKSLHLCETCAEEQGVQTGAAKSPLAGFLATVAAETKAGVALPDVQDTRRCDFCDGTLQDFRDSGRLGCPHCYEIFGQHLRDLLRRIHGSSQHVGEVYLAPGAPQERDEQAVLQHLRDQLRRAVETENFELAAELRDRLRVLE